MRGFTCSWQLEHLFLYTSSPEGAPVAHAHAINSATRKEAALMQWKFPDDRSIDFEAEGAIVAAGRKSVLAVFERLVDLDLIKVTAQRGDR
jgi:hypothetical protein